MKKNETRQNTASGEEMRRAAEDLTSGSELEAVDALYKKWSDAVTDATWLDGPDEDYLTRRIFNMCRDYLVARTREIAAFACNARTFVAEEELVKVLAFDFHYTFDECEWNGERYDPEDDRAFDKMACTREFVAGERGKKAVVDALVAYILAGAVAARQIDSDAYALWRQALVDCQFTYDRFDRGADAKDVKSLLNAVKTAAQRTWADGQVAAEMKKPHRLP